jgi:hypothetical protein
MGVLGFRERDLQAFDNACAGIPSCLHAPGSLVAVSVAVEANETRKQIKCLEKRADDSTVT